MQRPEPQKARDAAPDRGMVIVLSRDLFFGMRIRNALKGMGFGGRIVGTEAAFADAIADGDVVLGIVDFNQPVAWEAIVPEDLPVSILAFGAHTDVDGFRKAKEAGTTRVISNGSFSEQLPALLERYAQRCS